MVSQHEPHAMRVSFSLLGMKKEEHCTGHEIQAFYIHPLTPSIHPPKGGVVKL